jgi:predicted amidohydrolase YtcJ
MHLVAWALQLAEPNLDSLASLHECLNKLEKAQSNLLQDEWLTGGGWNWNLWRENRQPGRRDLDGISTSRPIVLKSKDWHTLWCNTAALRAWNLMDTTETPFGALVERDSQGLPTGIFREDAAFHFMGRVPKPSSTKKSASVLLAQNKLLSQGITSVHSMEPLENFHLLRELALEGTLKLRVACYILDKDLSILEANPNLIKKNSLDLVRIAGIKIFTDGSLGSRTAFLNEPYEDTPSRGVCSITPKELNATVRRAERLGLPCAIHAIGDAANKMALDAFEKSRKRGFKSLKHRIEHCQLVSPRDIARFGTLKIVASVQPSHLISDLDMVSKAWGARGRYAYPFGTLARSGARLIFGSDAPVEEPSPLNSIFEATTRTRQHDGASLYPDEEKISEQQALKSLTIEPARAVGEQKWRGSIATGKIPDFVCIATKEKT